MIRLGLVVVLLPGLILAGVRQHPGGKRLPHDKYIRVVSEAESPVERHYIPSKDGLYIAAAIRKPKGPGPFPVFLHFHGAPGGRGMDKLVSWALGTTGGPVWERFLQEGYVVVVADYRASNFRTLGQPVPEGVATMADDGVSVVEYMGKLPYVDPERIHVYGVSLGGDVTMHIISRTRVRAAILGAGAPMTYLSLRGLGPPGKDVTPAQRAEFFRTAPIDMNLVGPRLQAVSCPLMILVGTDDGLMGLSERLHDLLEQAGKPVRLEVYENGYHDFVMGPQGHPGRDEPLMDITLDALEEALRFFRNPSEPPPSAPH